jgi:Phosphoesterase family
VNPRLTLGRFSSLLMITLVAVLTGCGGVSNSQLHQPPAPSPSPSPGPTPSPSPSPTPSSNPVQDICTSATDSRCTFASLTHTAPPYDAAGDFTRYGYRVPLAVISPFTKSGYVSHVTTDYTAWLKFVEKRFNLQPLNARDGWANTSDMSDFFDFKNPPWMTPPQNPPNDNNGACYDSLP